MSSNTNSDMIEACRFGNLERATTILQQCNLSDYPGWSGGYVLLSQALENNMGKSVEIAKLLLKHGAKVNSKANALRGNSNTPLHHAVCIKNIEIVEMLLNHGAVVNSRNKNKKMPLHLAIENESEEIVQLLLRKGADLESTELHGYRPLHLAASKRNVKIVQYILNYGAKVNSVCQFMNRESNTALYLAAERKLEDIVKLLLEHGADVNFVSTATYQNERRNTSVLHTAVKYGNDGIVKVLLQYGATINSSYNSSSELLHIATSRRSDKIVQLLLEDNNEIEGQDEKGFTVLHKAVKVGKVEIVKLLLEKGCSVNSTANSGMTPLSTATENGDTQLVQILLDHNASTDTKDAGGMTALHKAVEKGNKDIVQMLIDKGSSVNDTTILMTTPLHIAVRKKHESIVKLLLDQGAFIDAEDKDNKTALCFAAEVDVGILDLVLSSKPNVENENNKLALRLVILRKWKNLEMVKKLLSYGFTLRSEDTEDKAIFEATVEGGYLKLVEYILQNNSKLERASTVVNVAVVNKGQEMVDLLLNHGFHADVKDLQQKAPMYYAYTRCDSNMCKFLLSKGVNVDSTIFCTYTLLHVAVENADKEFIEYLLKQGANVNAATKSHLTSLHIACEKGFETIVKLLLKYNADIHVKDKDGYTPLHKAVKADNQRIARCLLSRGSNINDATNSMVTSLHLAVVRSRGMMVYELLKEPVNVNAKDSTKKTALHYAVLKRSPDDIEICALLDKNPDLEDINNKLALCLAILVHPKYIVNIFLSRRFTIEAEDFEKFEIPEPLHSKLEACSVQEEFMKVSQDLLKRKSTTRAIFQYQVLRASVNKGFVEIVRQLLKQDLNLNALLENGQTLLHDAIESAQLLVAEELLKHGAKVNAADKCKRTPLHISLNSKNIAFLLKHKADVEARNEDCETPLHLAADRGDFIAKVLLRAGANVNSANKKGFTPLHLAAKGRHERVVQLLLDHDAEIDVENEQKKTPLEVANETYLNEEVLKLLLEYGSKYRINQNSSNFYYSNELLIMRHAIKMQAANLNDIKVEVIPPHMDDFRKKCENEVQRMKCEEITRSISLLDFLTKRQSKVAEFTRNEKIMKMIDTREYEEKFPLYRSMLEIRINKGKNRNELMERGAACLKSLLENLELKVPDLVIHKIFSFLSNRDLRNLIYTFLIEIEENSTVRTSERYSREELLEELFK